MTSRIEHARPGRAAMASYTFTLMHMALSIMPAVRDGFEQIWANVDVKRQREPTLPDRQPVDAYGPRHRTPAGALLGASSP